MHARARAHIADTSPAVAYKTHLRGLHNTSNDTTLLSCLDTMLTGVLIEALGDVVIARDDGTELSTEHLRMLMKISSTAAEFVEALYTIAVHDYDRSKGSIAASTDAKKGILVDNLMRLVTNAAAGFDQEEAHTLSHFCDDDNSAGAIAIKIGALHRLQKLQGEEERYSPMDDA